MIGGEGGKGGGGSPEPRWRDRGVPITGSFYHYLKVAAAKLQNVVDVGRIFLVRSMRFGGLCKDNFSSLSLFFFL